jgi:hypothetical protein
VWHNHHSDRKIQIFSKVFFEDIVKYKSVSVVGLAKNVGKTETLNYILRKLHEGGTQGKRFAVTSIGIDGETLDQVTQTAKPEIEVYEGMIFVTSEKHYHQKQLVAEVLDVDMQRTALGRLVTACAVTEGKVILSGPATTAGLQGLIAGMERQGITTTFVDGALSRLSLASPAVTEAMVLTTGGAVARTVAEVVRKTKSVCDLVRLKEVGEMAADSENVVRVVGMLTSRMLEQLRMQPQAKETLVVVHDFTRIFATPEVFYSFLKKGGRIRVEQRPHLVAVTVNPVSPEGYILDDERLMRELMEAVELPVYNVRKCD